MPYPHVIHHGAVSGVTTSCHQLPMDARSLLLADCCLPQGRERTVEGSVGAEQPNIPFALDDIKALIVTRAHAGPVDRIPHLLAAVFQRPLLCSAPPAKLLPLILVDGFMLQLNRAPKHIERYLQPLRRQVIGLPFDQWFAVAQTSALRACIRLQKAGHKQTARYLACTGRPAIIVKRVSGRIVDYLKAMLGDPGHNVIFTGYQARSAAGPSIKKYGPQGGFVELEGQRCIIRAGESALAGNWARADQQDLLNFVSGREQRPEQISLVHGEIVATQILKKAVGLASNTQ